MEQIGTNSPLAESMSWHVKIIFLLTFHNMIVLNSGQDFPVSSHISPFFRRFVYEIRNLRKDELTEERWGRKKRVEEGRKERRKEEECSSLHQCASCN